MAADAGARDNEFHPSTFASSGPDRAAIDRLLATHTSSVTRKDRASFEAILQNTRIPFAEIGTGPATSGPETGIGSYDDFAREIFNGPPVRQTFQDIDIAQDGPLANVRPVFVNTE